MAVSDDKINSFFKKQKVSKFSNLEDINKPKEILNTYTNRPLANREQSVSNPLAIREQSVSNPLANREQSVSNPLANREQSVSNPLANREQSVSNPLANREQSVSNPLAIREQSVSNPLANREQSVSNLLANREQSVSNPLANREQSVSNPLANREQSVSNPLANREQSVSNPLAKTCINKEQTTILLNKFSNKELDLLILVFRNISSNKGEYLTQLNTPQLLENIDVSNIRLRNLIQRIKEKGDVEIYNIKSGRYALRSFNLSKNLYLEIKKHLEIKAPIYNNSINIINKENSNYQNKPFLEEENDDNDWLNIDFSPLTDFGFRKSHITQLSKVDSLTPDMVQESIYHYAWALKNNLDEMIRKYDERFEKNKLGLLIGSLKKGSEWIEASYQSPEDLAQEEILKAKKTRLEKIKQQKLEMFETEFELWYEELTKEGRVEVEASFHAPAKSMHPQMLKEGYKSYFKNNVYEN